MKSHEVEIWNLANELGATQVPDDTPIGLKHLAHLMRFHNAVMGGGLSFAVEISSPEDIDRAQCGAQYLGLTDVAALIGRFAGPDKDYELAEELDHEYYKTTGEDAANTSVIDPAFGRRLATSPADFGL
ncbi:MAG TPA: hypothetical protein VFC19_44080 [Candidatus Limnocylindrales bacterium]|nr:hypothetical protein [Candidatus Limnocylindrales bacterium]